MSRVKPRRFGGDRGEDAHLQLFVAAIRSNFSIMLQLMNRTGFRGVQGYE